LTLDQPKHLLDIAGRPMLAHLLDRLAEGGVESGVLVTNHRFIDKFEEFTSSHSCPIGLTLLDDMTESNQTRLGSIGDLQFGLQQANVTDDFLVVNGDNLFTFSMRPMMETFQQRGNSIVLYDVGSLEVASLMGQAICDSDGRVTDFVEKPEHPSTTMISAGIYLFQAQVRELVDRYLVEGHSPDRSGDFVKWLHREVPVYGHEISAGEGVWFDIGSWDQYQEANQAYGGDPIPLPES
jgi:glucose-1-phosphate thymidylyltransferase